MKNKLRRARARSLLQPLESGQVWQLEDSRLEIGLVGKTLVHYKHFKGDMKRSPGALLNKITLEKFLRENRAVLVPRTTSPVSSRA